MGLFRSEYRDPELGTFTKLLFGAWTGKFKFLGGEVSVRLPGTRQTPDPGALAMVKELPRRYPALQAEIQKRLFEHYEPYRDSVDAGEETLPEDRPFPQIKAPSEVWSSTTPVRVIVESTKASRFEIAFEVTWDEEHTVGATIENWTVLDFSGSVPP
jgi:hypothetical protein